MSETTCLISGNPPHGAPKIGSVGFPFPYTEVRILDCDDAGTVLRELPTGEVGEICVSNPGVIVGGTYTEPGLNAGLYADGRFLRTGDLGKLDDEGYLWITGRRKDVIIRGGHNIDPGVIEEALLAHPQVAFAGAIGQPDSYSGELPCAYVELIEGAEVSIEDLHAHVVRAISDPTAVPKHLEVMETLPKTAVGKIFKPDIRRMAIRRVFDAALEEAGLPARLDYVEEVKGRGLVAMIAANGSTDEDIQSVLGGFSQPWQRES